ncbi:MAG: glycosyltransferase family 87 protein, partial [Candidatus Thorarchaeota archaeon]
MWGTYSPLGICRKYRNYLVLSLVLSFALVPFLDATIVQRDRNRNMLYGELFLTEGVAVYDLTDKELNETYTVPADHLLTGILNVSYEYPIVALVFFSLLAAIEPGMFGPHYIVNFVMAFIMHLNIIFFLYLGQDYWDRRWFKQFFIMYYIFGLSLAIGFGKAEPLADFLWLCSLVLFRNGKLLPSGGILGIAAQTKLYPAMVLPILAVSNPLILITFLVVSGILFLPMLLAGLGYNTLIQHLLNTTSYATSISNPFYIGFVTTNPLSIIAPAVLILSFIYSIFELRKLKGIPIPTLKLRTREWRSIFIFALPLVLIFFSWVLIWYYFWFIIPVLYFENEQDQSRYRYIFIGLILAHFIGVLVNLDYL